MTLIIVLMFVAAYLLIATGHFTGVNKAAIAMFLGTAGWVVYVCYGTDFVMQQHPADYLEYLSGRTPNSETVKYFICENVFLKYVGKAAAIVMFLLATMSIIELLNNNGCFDFISEWIRTRNSKRLLWTITLATFIISANLDNLTTTTMMLVIMNNVLQSGRQRMLVGSAIVLAATCGGCFTVIGDPVGLILWGDGMVTASHFSAYMLLPALIAWIVPTMLINRELPDRLDTEWIASPYRGDDTRLNRWQRLVMLFVGIGGLWFIPTFHNITKLSPFLGALCVLSVLWLVNEAFNRRLMNADQMAQRRIPRALQYGTIQQILFVMGIMMGMGVMLETGVLGDIGIWLAETFHNNWLLGIGAGLLSAVADSFTVGLNHIMLYPLAESGEMAVNGAYWMIMVFSTAVGGCLLCVGSVGGVALMKMEHVRLGWYLRHLTSKVAVGWLLGLAVLWAELHLL
ncbi:sodium:proton antiporter [Prevotella sp. P3-120]|uniref:SLC13 family permease n=1 Tax=Prevotella sp. P3-120 TaxID=2024220 RepID=UPI000B965A8F|nr:SLC13 family permease [Prevotella sp. P3-120]OYP50115.1 sodium:proton antiporter [Prevotella sp. P3-120]